MVDTAHVQQTAIMVASRHYALLAVAALITTALPVHGLTTQLTGRPAPPPTMSQRPLSFEDESVLDSLRNDVTHHPNEYVVFETRSAANSFITAHWADAQAETEQRAVRRGIVGYWLDKTVVVLPSLSSAK